MYVKLYNNISKLRVDRINSKKERKIKEHVSAADALNGPLDAYSVIIF